VATEFTPIAALLGGGFIGAAAVLLMLATGRIAGVSGMLSRLLAFKAETSSWRLAAAFLGGLIACGTLWATFDSTAVTTPGLSGFSASIGGLALAGLLVGVGTVLGNGCTSGHGVCGISRLSVRSIAATATFMAAAGVTVYVIRHVLEI